MNTRPDATPHAVKPSANGDFSARLLSVVSTLTDELHPGRALRVSLVSHLERDLGLDSLARVELLLRLGNEFGFSLPEAALAEAETPRDLLHFIGEKEKIGKSASSPEAFVSLPHDMISGLPDQSSTLTEVLQWHAAHHPQRTHVLLYGETGQARTITPITYSGLSLCRSDKREKGND